MIPYRTLGNWQPLEGGPNRDDLIRMGLVTPWRDYSPNVNPSVRILEASTLDGFMVLHTAGSHDKSDPYSETPDPRCGYCAERIFHSQGLHITRLWNIDTEKYYEREVA